MSKPTLALIGFESVGKTALFRLLTGESCGDETNFRGSTVSVRAGTLRSASERVIDTPGIRLKGDSETTRLALEQVREADVLVLVARATHVVHELGSLLDSLRAEFIHRRLALILTHGDKLSPPALEELKSLPAHLHIPVAVLDAKRPAPADRAGVLAAIRHAAALDPDWDSRPLPALRTINPPATWFEKRVGGPVLALAAMGLLFTLPILFAYRLAAWAQPLVDDSFISPMKAALGHAFQSAPLFEALLIGDYGLLTLGWYSFLWAFPVVLFIGVSVAMTEETGLKDRITAALDPCLRWVGLSGRDLIPVLSGYGCNVVAVMQTRACSSCTRKNCLSMIAFGSACSYQIGASLSIFNSSGHSWLFAPYLFLLFLMGAVHTRLWNRGLPREESSPLVERAFLQPPTWKGTAWRIRSVLHQFLLQAMPIFLLICVAGALLQYSGLIDILSRGIAPILTLFALPPETAPGIVFSILRKDGLLILNQGDGRLLASLSSGQIFVLVYLSSTLTACMVTLWAIRKEMGWRHAVTLAGRQAFTSAVSALFLASMIPGLRR